MSESLPSSINQEYIAARYGSRATPLVELGAGAWSKAYSFALDERDSVVRFGLYGEDFFKDQVMGERSSPALPIPKVVDIGETDSGYFVVAERGYGEFLDQLDGDSMKDALPSVFRALDAMRDLDISHTSGYGHWNPDGTATHESWADALLDVSVEHPRSQGWRAALEISPGGAEVFDIGMEKLKSLVKELPNERSIVHNDLLNRNVLVKDGRLSAVFDWGNSLYGDHLYDAALLLYWWSWFPKWSSIDIREELSDHLKSQGEQPHGLDLRLLTYQLHIGLEHIAYTAFVNRPDDLARNKEQVKTLLREIEQS
jgi:hygromycin-B 4-O-kinase